MKYPLLTLAMLGMFAGTASAQNNVTLYGVVDAGLNWLDNGATSTTRLNSGQLNGSRWGVRGSEDLGGGLSANFQLESGINIDDGTLGQGGLIFGRQAWVGLKGGFGHVKLGRQNNVLYVASAFVYDPFGISLAGDASKFFRLLGSRTNNTIDYSFSANGFTGELAYGLGEVAGNSSANRNLGGLLRYKAGPVDAVLAYHRQNNASGNDNASSLVLGGNYDLGPARLYAAFGQEKGTGSLKQRQYLIGATAPVGAAGTLIASYIRKSDRTVSKADASQIAVGYTHDLSKRTALYASYSRISNDDAASYGGAASAGDSVNQLGFGVRHRF
jgi:predicted porin